MEWQPFSSIQRPWYSGRRVILPSWGRFRRTHIPIMIHLLRTRGCSLLQLFQNMTLIQSLSKDPNMVSSSFSSMGGDMMERSVVERIICRCILAQIKNLDWFLVEILQSIRLASVQGLKSLSGKRNSNASTEKTWRSGVTIILQRPSN